LTIIPAARHAPSAPPAGSRGPDAPGAMGEPAPPQKVTFYHLTASGGNSYLWSAPAMRVQNQVILAHRSGSR
ncbi:MAG: hypothetical protein Q8R28_02005, partial [Dehalococcoidia bacterium]|nr:hypothetical protein [Dehalococcoidia bacterium]